MEPFTLAWAAGALNAEVRSGGAEGTAVSSVCTDTRQIRPGALFFALQGENTDGHGYVARAFEAGAAGAVVSRVAEGAGGPQIVVPDTLQALGGLACAYRKQFDIPVVGITGSVGKTSTKEMAAHVLRTKYNVLASEKNHNNEIGVPLTLFRLTREHEVAVIEMGMRGLGQIDYLAAIARPTVGVITNIGYAHVELLGSRDAIATAKSELLTRLPPGGFAVLPYRDGFFENLMSRVPEGVTVLTYGEGGEAVWPPDVRIYPQPARRGGSGAEAIAMIHRREAFFALKAPGAHLLHNAGAALAVSHALDMPLCDAAEALETWEGAPGRMNLIVLPDGPAILDDCYNAGPESMAAALDTLAQSTVFGGVAVLGDMRELGGFAAEAHRMVGRKAVDVGVRVLVTVGELAREIGEEAARHAVVQGKTPPERRHFADAGEAAHAVLPLVGPKDAVLVKGSRAVGMEVIVAALAGQRRESSGEAGAAHG